MAISTATAGGNVNAERSAPLASDYVHKWSLMCGEFLAWEREHMLQGDPSAKEQEEHRRSLQWLLRLTRVIHSIVADPDFPDPSLAYELEGRLLQLQSSWRMFYEAMPADQAEQLLAEVFPDESRTGATP